MRNGAEGIVVHIGDPLGGIGAPGPRRRRDLVHLGHQEAREIDVVRAEITGCAAAGLSARKAPGQRRLLHVEQELAAEVTDLADRAARDHVAGEMQGRHEAMDVGAHMRHAGLLGRLPDRESLLGGRRQGLFAEHRLAGLRRGNGGGRVRVVRSGVDEQVDVGPHRRALAVAEEEMLPAIASLHLLGDEAAFGAFEQQQQFDGDRRAGAGEAVGSQAQRVHLPDEAGTEERRADHLAMTPTAERAAARRSPREWGDSTRAASGAEVTTFSPESLPTVSGRLSTQAS